VTVLQLLPQSERRAPPVYRVLVRENGTAVHTPDSTTECVLGHHVRIDYNPLENFYWQSLESVHIDLLLLAGVVMFADRRHPRNQSVGWSRHLEVTMPVHEPTRWMQSCVSARLEDALRFLTGDTWSFVFTRRLVPEGGHLKLQILARPGGNRLVLPYSGGLDSLAALRMVGRDRDVSPMLVSTQHGAGRWHSKAGATHVPTGSDSRTVPRIPVPVRFSPGEHAERSCRSRMFLFFSAATVAAYLADTTHILVPEAGQGSLAVNVVPSAYESPPRGTHPGFSRRFADFVQALLGTQLRFDHRFLWQTKGETLRQLSELGLASNWQAARSCARKLYRRRSGAGLRTQCGVCSNCLLRRVSLVASGLDSEPEREEYLWHDLAATSVSGSVHPRFEHVPTRVSDEKIAASAVHLHQAVADASLLPDAHSRLRQAAHEVGRALSIPRPEALRKLRALLDQHRREWTSFLAMLPARSWVVQRAGDA
jgi:hypothetical protein